MDYVMLAKVVSRLSGLLNETDDVGDCMYWGPCELCEWGVEKFDNFANETINKGVFDWRSKWDLAMEKLDGKFFGEKWLVKIGSSNKNFADDSLNNFFSKFKCGSNIPDVPLSYTTYYDGSKYSNIQIDVLSHLFLHTANVDGVVIKDKTNSYTDDTFILLMGMLQKMFCTNATMPILIDQSELLNQSPSKYTNIDESAYKEDPAYDGKILNMQYNNKYVASVSAFNSNYNYISGSTSANSYLIPTVIPSLTQMSRAGLESMMIYGWKEARNMYDRAETYQKWCTKNEFCSSDYKSHYKLGEDSTCAIKGLTTYIIKKIISLLI